ncbi:MAG: HNH endonuclease [Planctomycetia bacterium]
MRGAGLNRFEPGTGLASFHCGQARLPGFDARHEPDEHGYTDRQALVKARVGQGIFRDQVLNLWSYQCSVTGCGIQEALRASHIKPWSESTDQERLDPYNGLPLLATLDALFDKHLIGFDLQGKMLISSELSKPERELLLPRKRRLLRKPDHVTARFLKEHAKLLR